MDRFYEAKQAAKHELKQTGVTGFGIGEDRLRVYVSDEAVASRIPKTFKGVPVETVLTRSIRPLAGQ